MDDSFISCGEVVSGMSPPPHPPIGVLGSWDNQGASSILGSQLPSTIKNAAYDLAYGRQIPQTPA